MSAPGVWLTLVDSEVLDPLPRAVPLFTMDAALGTVGRSRSLQVQPGGITVKNLLCVARGHVPVYVFVLN